MHNAIHWFEIFVNDLDRATRFYETTLGVQLRREIFGGTPIAVFEAAQEATGGALVRNPQYTPGAGGQLVYLDAEGKLDAVLGRVGAAGGAVVMPRTSIGPAGFIALVRDTEGNVVGLHSHV